MTLFSLLTTLVFPCGIAKCDRVRTIFTNLSHDPIDYHPQWAFNYSECLDGRVRQFTLLNLGRRFALPQQEWPARGARLDQPRSGQGTLLAGVGSERVEPETQRWFAPLVDAPRPRPTHRPRGRGWCRRSNSTRWNCSARAAGAWSPVALGAMVKARLVGLLQGG